MIYSILMTLILVWKVSVKIKYFILWLHPQTEVYIRSIYIQADIATKCFDYTDVLFSRIVSTILFRLLCDMNICNVIFDMGNLHPTTAYRSGFWMWALLMPNATFLHKYYYIFQITSRLSLLFVIFVEIVIFHIYFRCFSKIITYNEYHAIFVIREGFHQQDTYGQMQEHSTHICHYLPSNTFIIVITLGIVWILL